MINLNLNETTSGINNNNNQNEQSYPVPTPLIKDINKANTFIKNPDSKEINIQLFKQRETSFLFFRNNYYLKDVEIQNQEKIKKKMEEGKSVMKEYQEIEAKIDKIKKEIENIRKLKILDDKKEKEEELTKKENVFMTEFTSL